MGFFKRTKKKLPPHKLHPDVLHWREGDELVYMNVVLNGPFEIDIDSYEEKNKKYAFYKSLSSEGYIIIEEKESGNLSKYEFRKFIKAAKNISFQNRIISLEIKESNNYMELIESFQKAYTELQESDNPKLLE
tara:strand:- start:19723 stop:20121 length:399 start_codon:yes stop_codon:yes gene_type:complete